MTGSFAAMMLYGGGTSGGSGSVTLNNANLEAQGSGSPSATWKIDSDGYVYEQIDGAGGPTYQWTADPVANYEVRATKDAGSDPTGSSLATWLACSSDRDWTVTDTTANEIARYSYLTIEVRDAATLEVKASCTVHLIAEKI